MIKFELKQAEKEDFKEIAKIYAEEFSKEPYNEPWTKEKAIYKIDIYSRYCDIFKIIIENKIIGFIIFNPNYWCPGEIVFCEEIAIKQEFQNKGIGKDTFRRLFNNYKEKGYKKAMGIANRKGRALNFYRKLGVRESEENVIIEKEL